MDIKLTQNLLLTAIILCFSPTLAAADCETDVTACSVTELCKTATIVKRGHLEWNFDALDHVSSAKEYGLSCGVDMVAKQVEVKETSQAIFTKSDFVRLNKLQRHQIQYALKRLGYYSSGVDGLWGKGTERAVNNYMAAEGITKDLAPNVYKSLIQSVDVSNVKLKPEARSTKITTASRETGKKVQICKLNDSPAFERVLIQEEFVSRAVKELQRLREIKIADGTATIGPKKIKQRDNKTYTVYTRVRCADNINGWSRCGSFQARAILSPRGTDGLSGKLYLPSEWPLYNGSLHKLEYTCSNK